MIDKINKFLTDTITRNELFSYIKALEKDFFSKKDFKCIQKITGLDLDKIKYIDKHIKELKEVYNIGNNK